MEMEGREVSRLQRIAACAEEIRTKLRDLAAAQNGRVHFRPTNSGITMVSLLPDRPQYGSILSTVRVHLLGRPWSGNTLQWAAGEMAGVAR